MVYYTSQVKQVSKWQPHIVDGVTIIKRQEHLILDSKEYFRIFSEGKERKVYQVLSATKQQKSKVLKEKMSY